MRKIQFIVVKSDLGASMKGSAKGPDSIMKAASEQQKDLFKRHSLTILDQDQEKVTVEFDSKWAKNIDQIFSISQKVAEQVRHSMAENRFALLLSGDHSTDVGSLAGFRQAFPNDAIGVIWIDAHADLHSPYTTPSGNLHGMPLAVALGLDNLHLQRNIPDDQAIRSWNALKTLGGHSPIIRPADLIYIGLRQMESEEEQVIKDLQIPFVTVEELRSDGAARTAERALTLLNHCAHILVSFDVDSLDPTVSAATGTPVSGGFTREEALILLNTLCTDQRVKCLEIVEINPDLEPGNSMGELAFELAESVTELVSKQANHAY